MSRLYPPPKDYTKLPQWRALAETFPRVRAMAATLPEHRRSLAYMLESAMQNGAWGYLRAFNNGEFARTFRVLFPRLPSRPSQRAIAAAILEEQRKGTVTA